MRKTLCSILQSQKEIRVRQSPGLRGDHAALRGTREVKFVLRAPRDTVLWERRDRGGLQRTEKTSQRGEMSQALEMGVSGREERARCRQGELPFLLLSSLHAIMSWRRDTEVSKTGRFLLPWNLPFGEMWTAHRRPLWAQGLAPFGGLDGDDRTFPTNSSDSG